ncbi:MAG: 4Fe-4S dicluster domain-containing protein [bacterium]|nr:4Fe-4S dicluster domain-containing protein [bacterium]
MTNPTFSHSIKIDKERCIGCVTCMKACPTKAIRTYLLRDVPGSPPNAAGSPSQPGPRKKNKPGSPAHRHPRRAVIDFERCIDCGRCLRVCPHSAVIPIMSPTSELNKFKFKIALTSPVLYSQFGQKADPNDILAVLKEVGFDYVCDDTVMNEMVGVGIGEFLKEHRGQGPYISSGCPVVVRLIQRLFPGLCDRIVPIEPPRELAARNLREEISKGYNIPPNAIGIFLITSCAAKMVSINHPESMAKSHLDGGISIKEIYNSMKMRLEKKKDTPLSMLQVENRISGIGLGWAIPGGEVRGVKFRSVSVAGLHDTISILEDLEAGKLKNIDYLECHICPDGGLGGPLAVENRFIAHSNFLVMLRMYAGKKTVDTDRIKQLYKDGFFAFESGVKPKPFPPLDEDRGRALEKLNKRNKLVATLPGINCGVCGAPDCKTLADDVVRDKTGIPECIFSKDDFPKDKNIK